MSFILVVLCLSESWPNSIQYFKSTTAVTSYLSPRDLNQTVAGPWLFSYNVLCETQEEELPPQELDIPHSAPTGQRILTLDQELAPVEAATPQLDDVELLRQAFACLGGGGAFCGEWARAQGKATCTKMSLVLIRTINYAQGKGAGCKPGEGRKERVCLGLGGSLM